MAELVDAQQSADVKSIPMARDVQVRVLFS